MRILKWTAKLAFSALLLSVLIRAVGWDRIGDALSTIEVRWIFVFYSLSLVTRTIYALQMSQLLRFVAVEVGFARVFLANSLALLYSLVTPGDIVAGAAKWSDLSAATGQRSVVLNSMIYNRLTLLVVPLVVGSLAIFWENPFSDSRLHLAISILALAVAGTAFSLFSPHASPFVESLLSRVAGKLPEVIGRRIEMLMVSLRRFHSMNARHHATILAYAFVGTMSAASGTYVATLAFGIEIPFAVLLWTQPVLLVARQLPITIGNLGVREGLLIYLFGLYGVAAERSFGVGILTFSGLVLMAIVGLAYQVALLLGLTKGGGSGDVPS